MYRWGNPQIYNAGDNADKQLFGQHDAQWIQDGSLGEGNVLVFNNGQGRPDGQYSSIIELTTPVNSTGFYEYLSGQAFQPDELTWEYIAENPSDFYSPKISGAQRLPNGNTIICQGDDGFFFEVTYDKEIVWEYSNPYPALLKRNVFKVHKYGRDYPGLSHLFERPDVPNIPDGPSSGEPGIEYTFSTSTSDPDGDQIYYLFDWGDGTQSDWLGPFDSEEVIYASHVWDSSGSFDLSVKAMDVHGFESEWSDSLLVSMPKSKEIQSFFIRFLESYPYIFSILQRLLGL